MNEQQMKPAELSAMESIFPVSVSALMPDQAEIPEDFKRFNGNQWVRLTSRWFFQGLPIGTEFVPAEGIDQTAALRHIKAVLGSFEPKHEHKESAVAYLLSLWFTEVRIPGESAVSA